MSSTFTPVAAPPSWEWAQSRSAAWKQDGPVRKFTLKPQGASINGEAAVSGEQGKVAAKWTFVPEKDAELASLAVTADFGAPTLGLTYVADTIMRARKQFRGPPGFES